MPAAVASSLERVSKRTLFPRQHGFGNFANGTALSPFFRGNDEFNGFSGRLSSLIERDNKFYCLAADDFVMMKLFNLIRQGMALTIVFDPLDPTLNPGWLSC